MKKLVTLAVAAVAIASMLPAASAAPKQQVVEGTVHLPIRFPADLESCFAGAHRRVAIASAENVNGVIGYHFDVDKSSLNKNFLLEVTGGQGAVDLDITFYAEFGTLEQATDTGFAPPNVSFEERGPGGEAGKVPPGMTKAIVCVFDGVESSFKFTAGKGVKVPQ